MSDVLETTWPQVLAWRMARQWVDPIGRAQADAVAIVRRLCGVQAQVLSAAAQAIRVRQAKPKTNEVDTALEKRKLMRTWGVRGTLHLLAPDEAGAYLALVGAARMWEKKVWTKTFGPTPEEMAELTEVVGEILDDRVLSREELVAEVGQRLGHDDLAEQLRSGWGAVLKPIAWQGQLCHAPAEGNRVAFTRPSSWLPDWGGVPSPEEAAAVALPAYLGAYGPATPVTFDAWLTRGNNRKPVVRGWFESLGDELAPVSVEGEDAYLLAADVDGLAKTEPSSVVRLLPAFDQYVLGPGTNAAAVVPQQHRSEISRKGGWIAPVVVFGGRVVGVWEPGDDKSLQVSLFDDADRPPAAALKAEVSRVEALLG